MNLSRSIHDELSEDLLEVSYQFDSIIGREEISNKSRSQIRTIQSEISALVEKLRHEILNRVGTEGIVFSIDIRAQISLIRKLTQNLESIPETQKLLGTIAEILAFPLSYLTGEKLGIRDTYDLTKREKEVLRILPRGLTAKAMASELFLTEATVKTHLAAIYRKLGVVNRTQAIAVGLDSKLLTF